MSSTSRAQLLHHMDAWKQAVSSRHGKRPGFCLKQTIPYEKQVALTRIITPSLGVCAWHECVWRLHFL